MQIAEIFVHSMNKNVIQIIRVLCDWTCYVLGLGINIFALWLPIQKVANYPVNQKSAKLYQMQIHLKESELQLHSC